MLNFSSSTRSAVGAGRTVHIRGLDAEAWQLYVAGLSGRTSTSYSSAKRGYQQFCFHAGISPFPATELSTCRFVEWLAKEGFHLGLVSAYLSALRHLSIKAGLGPMSQATWPELAYVVKGLERELRDVPTLQRLPITLDVLRKLKAAWESGLEDKVTAFLLWAVSWIAFFGCFRLDELLLSKTTETPALRQPDVFFRSKLAMVMHLRFSKTGQNERDINVHIGATLTDICPFVALQNYLRIRLLGQGPLFMWADGNPVLKSSFVLLVRKAL
uniref:Core-binding (CB) domain-containing protein n=1 Tax=Amphimedon queenslandica TaxID=400682 RepID=A0A1X7USK8_AMPQE